MKKNQRIQIEKLRPVQDPLFPTPDAADYVYGKDNGNVSLPVEYSAIGVLTADVETGKPLEMLRESRNGVSVPGLFNTSPIVGIVKNSSTPNLTILHTRNSVYEVTTL